MKQILVVNLHLDAKYSRSFEKLVSRIKEAGGSAVVSDFMALPHMDPEAVNTSYRGVVLSGTEALYTRSADRIRFADLIKYLPKVAVPILGICGGYQALALAYGGSVAKMQVLVQGFRTITLEDKDTLLAGLSAKIKVMQSHREEVKLLPPNFLRIATSKDTENEGIRHTDRPVYGVQFHPERWNEANRAGKRILENFVQKIA